MSKNPPYIKATYGTLTVAIAQVFCACPSIENALECIKAVASRIKSTETDRTIDLLVFPELFIGGYGTNKGTLIKIATSFEFEGGAQKLGSIAQQFGFAICTGLPELVYDGDQTETTSIRNAAIVVDSDGNEIHRYRKTHLWASYERSVFVGGPAHDLNTTFTLSRHIERAHNDLQQIQDGSSDHLVDDTQEIRPPRLSVVICYDIEYPEVVRVKALHGADALIALVAGGKTDRSTALYTTRVRAMENHIGVVFCNFPSTNWVDLQAYIDKSESPSEEEQKYFANEQANRMYVMYSKQMFGDDELVNKPYMHQKNDKKIVATKFCGLSRFCGIEGEVLAECPEGTTSHDSEDCNPQQPICDVGVAIGTLNFACAQYNEYKQRNPYFLDRLPEMYTSICDKHEPSENSL